MVLGLFLLMNGDRAFVVSDPSLLSSRWVEGLCGSSPCSPPPSLPRAHGLGRQLGRIGAFLPHIDMICKRLSSTDFSKAFLSICPVEPWKVR